MDVAGEAIVQVELEGTIKKPKLYLIKGQCPALFGWSWIRAFFGEGWITRMTNGMASTVSDNIDSGFNSPRNKVLKLLDSFKDTVFKPGLGTLKGISAHLELKKDVTPKFCKARPVPFALKGKIESTLDEMEKQGQLEKTMTSDWASPIVPVQKPNVTMRICGDYKITLNKNLEINHYPLPRYEECFQAMKGGQKFSKLDLKQAFNQVPLDESSKNLTTMNTSKGLYRWKRLPFGIASSPGIFANIMDKVLQSLSGVAWYQDDIIITGPNDQKHIDNLKAVLERLDKYGLTVCEAKCEFLQDSVIYLGFRIDKNGISLLPERVSDLKRAPTPTNLKELASFLGMIQYYGKFISNFATITEPLNLLRRKEVPWHWTDKQQMAFEAVKNALTSNDVLVHYDEGLPLKLDCDASSVGLGVVLSHTFPDGVERPISFASRTLSNTERNYAQIEKEALSIVWGIKKFHQYLYGRKFTLVTDHKPLTTIFSPSKQISMLSTNRLNRWALFLMAYRYDIVYRSTDKHANADCLSRLPNTNNKMDLDLECATVNIQQIESLYIDVKRMARATETDTDLSRVLYYTKYGWPSNVEANLQAYHRRKQEIVTEENCLLWGMKVIIPQKLQNIILRILHEGHPGIVRMKELARSYVWWPNINSDLEHLVKKCHSCQEQQNLPPKAILHPLEFPSTPWERIHVDFAGPFENRMWMVIVDAHSKFPEVIPMANITAKNVIKELSIIYARYGYPMQLVTDNGPQFCGEEFNSFNKERGIRHIKTSPYHPSTNGAAERFVQTFKKGMKTAKEDERDPIERLNNFLRVYRSTPHKTTSTTPAELFFKRKVRGRLDLFHPSISRKVKESQKSQAKYHDQHAHMRELQEGDLVRVRDFRSTPHSWKEGIVTTKSGPLSYNVDVGDGHICRRHVDQITARVPNEDLQKNRNI